jgi:hypothetical protein
MSQLQELLDSTCTRPHYASYFSEDESSPITVFALFRVLIAYIYSFIVVYMTETVSIITNDGRNIVVRLIGAFLVQVAKIVDVYSFCNLLWFRGR